MAYTVSSHLHIRWAPAAKNLYGFARSAQTALAQRMCLHGVVGVAGVAEFIRTIASKKLFTSLYFRSCENPPGLGRVPYC